MATGGDDTSFDNKASKKSAIRLLLVGKTGHGKSETGNAILGQRNAFRASRHATSVTKGCAWKKAERDGRWIEVVDTPGLFDSSVSQEDIKRELYRSLMLSAPGFNAIALVINPDRFTPEMKELVKIFFDFFGEDVKKFAFIIFTHMPNQYHLMEYLIDQKAPDDNDDEEESELDLVVPADVRDTIAKHGERIHPTLKYLIDQCEGDMTIIENKTKNKKHKQAQVNAIFEMIEQKKAKTGKRYFRNANYKDVDRLLKIERDISKKATANGDKTYKPWDWLPKVVKRYLYPEESHDTDEDRKTETRGSPKASRKVHEDQKCLTVNQAQQQSKFETEQYEKKNTQTPLKMMPKQDESSDTRCEAKEKTVEKRPADDLKEDEKIEEEVEKRSLYPEESHDTDEDRKTETRGSPKASRKVHEDQKRLRVNQAQQQSKFETEQYEKKNTQTPLKMMPKQDESSDMRCEAKEKTVEKRPADDLKEDEKIEEEVEKRSLYPEESHDTDEDRKTETRGSPKASRKVHEDQKRLRVNQAQQQSKFETEQYEKKNTQTPLKMMPKQDESSDMRCEAKEKTVEKRPADDLKEDEKIEEEVEKRSLYPEESHDTDEDRKTETRGSPKASRKVHEDQKCLTVNQAQQQSNFVTEQYETKNTQKPEKMMPKQDESSGTRCEAKEKAEKKRPVEDLMEDEEIEEERYDSMKMKALTDDTFVDTAIKAKDAVWYCLKYGAVKAKDSAANMARAAVNGFKSLFW